MGAGVRAEAELNQRLSSPDQEREFMLLIAAMSDTPAERAQRIIEDAATRPLRDAAYLLFRQQDWFNRFPSR